MTLVTWRRLSSMPPPERELLDVEADGSFRLWRSIAPVVGRFGGSLPAGVVSELEGLVSAVGSAAAPRPGSLPADASVEQLEVGGARSVFEAGAEADPPWGDLLAACRRIADARTDAPVAAIALEVGLTDGRARIRLVQRGTGTLPVELASGRAKVAVWRGMENPANALAGFDLGRVEAGPGWDAETTAELPVLEAGDKVTATVTFIVDDGGVFIPVAMSATAVAPA
ncbi:MAG TPA: hypothetical protein VIZ22_02560 [Candidatus Limnocylindrales bacterium]